jgi:anti-anti-sigma factor
VKKFLKPERINRPLIVSNMNVKTDTKEKFHVITIQEKNISANMTAELEQLLGSYLQKDVKNVILNCKDIETIDDAAAEALVNCQQAFYEANHSFVICHLPAKTEAQLDEQGLLEIMNTTPTESEAWDIVQMEEIERELLNGDD